MPGRRSRSRAVPAVHERFRAAEENYAITGYCPASHRSSWDRDRRAGDATARYDNGVLTISIPVAEQAKPRKVAITSSPGTGETISAQSTAATNAA